MKTKTETIALWTGAFLWIIALSSMTLDIFLKIQYGAFITTISGILGSLCLFPAFTASARKNDPTKPIFVGFAISLAGVLNVALTLIYSADPSANNLQIGILYLINISAIFAGLLISYAYRSRWKENENNKELDEEENE